MLRTHAGDPGRVATLLPGRGYTPDAPLLHYTRRVLRCRGWTVRDVWWRDGSNTTPDAAMEQALAALDAVAAATHIVVAKSLGTLAMPYAVRHGLRGTWLTPLLADPNIAAAAVRLTRDDLLVGGTDDAAWDGGLAARSPAGVLEVDGANHGLEMPSSVPATLDVMKAVVARFEEFLDRCERHT